AELRAQVLEARGRQTEQFGRRGVQLSGRMTPRQGRKFCALKQEPLAILKAAMEARESSRNPPACACPARHRSCRDGVAWARGSRMSRVRIAVSSPASDPSLCRGWVRGPDFIPAGGVSHNELPFAIGPTAEDLDRLVPGRDRGV